MKLFATSLLFIISFLLVCTSCKKVSSNLTITDGTYTGTFQRQIAGAGNIANVSLVFNAGNWTGQSSTPRYPALCSGTFQSNVINEITFVENCVWTADFDWTLILNNKYTLSILGNTYTFTKDYTNGTKDIYILTKQ